MSTDTGGRLLGVCLLLISAAGFVAVVVNIRVSFLWIASVFACSLVGSIGARLAFGSGENGRS